MNWAWLQRNTDQILSWLVDHLWLAALPTILGLLIALPVGAIAHRYRWSRGTLLTIAALFYTIPSIALFVLLPGIIGLQILNPLNVVIALTLYTLALLIRVVTDALESVPPLVVQSASAMGYRPIRSLITVQLPLAIPVIAAGLRVAAVSNVSLVSVAALLGIPQLGQLFTVGFQLDFYTPIIAGIVMCLLVAALFDTIILVTARLATPWDSGGEGPMISQGVGGTCTPTRAFGAQLSEPGVDR